MNAQLLRLSDGTQLTVRPIAPQDAIRLRRMFERLSPASVYHRFFTPVVRPSSRAMEHLAGVDHRFREALVALDGNEVVGVARYDGRPGSTEAEVAVTVEDAWQGRGVGTRLLARLADVAASRGLSAFTAEILGENRQALGLLRRVSADARVRVDGGEYEIYAPLPRRRPELARSASR